MLFTAAIVLVAVSVLAGLSGSSDPAPMAVVKRALATVALGLALFAALGIGLRDATLRLPLAVYALSLALGMAPLPDALRYATTLIGLAAIVMLLRRVRRARAPRSG